VTFGPADQPGWVLSGHSDVVPVDGQDWTSDPFTLREEAGRLYGRGACDMKGFLACCFGMAPQIARSELKRPIHVAISYDEELGCTGVLGLLEHVAALPVLPLGCVVGEPTSMELVAGHKAKCSYLCEVTGTPGHSSRAPEFVNAVEYGARLIVKVQEIARRLSAGPRDEMYDTQHTTAHVGNAHCGTTGNILPEHFRFEFEIRAIADGDRHALAQEIKDYARDVVLPEMRRVSPRADIRFKRLNDYPGLDTAVDAPIMASVLRWAGQNAVKKVVFGTEAGLVVERTGIPTVVCGPGSIGEAHKPDEFITADRLARCEAFLGWLLESCCQS